MPKTDPEATLWEEVRQAPLPRHVAVIMDGNGRWAQTHHRPRVTGHKAGVEAVRATVETCARLGVPALTLYAFSAENWKRPRAEIGFLMQLLRGYLRSELAELQQQNIQLSAIGRLLELPPAVRRELEHARRATAGNSGMLLTLALNYSGRAEIVDACQALLDAACGAPLTVTEEMLAARLYTAGLPDPDLLIRTSGEHRISNFLLWQIAYTELYVTPVLWPDFRGRELLGAIADYQRRERRFGGLGSVARAAMPAGQAGQGAARK